MHNKTPSVYIIHTQSVKVNEIISLVIEWWLSINKEHLLLTNSITEQKRKRNWKEKSRNKRTTTDFSQALDEINTR